MRILVTGAKGQLGFDVVRKLHEQKIDCLPVDIDECDIRDKNETLDLLRSYMPDVVIHCAAYTAVDRAEDERELCYQINVVGTSNVAAACKAVGAKLLYLSTDYVFPGRGEQPYRVQDTPEPINYYGLTKFEGELAAQQITEKLFIVRISWVFGINGANFVKTMLKLAENRKKIAVVADQIGSPTYTYDLADLLIELVMTDKFGTYHASNEGYCSWYEFACQIMKEAKIDVLVEPIKTEEYPTKAKRPLNSRLDKSSLDQNGFTRLRNFETALAHFLKDLGYR